MLALHYDLPFFRHFNTGCLSLSLLSVMLLGYMYTLDWIVVIILCNTILLHINVTTTVLQRMIESRFDIFLYLNSETTRRLTTAVLVLVWFISRESQRIPKIKSRQTELLFRILQIHHKMAEDFIAPISPSTIVVAELLIITTLYCLIHLYSSIHFFLLVALFCVSIFTMVVLTLAIWLAARATECSQKYIDLGHSVQLSISKSEHLFLRSCYSIRFKIGDTFFLSRDSLATIYQDIIVAYTINLLLTFR